MNKIKTLLPVLVNKILSQIEEAEAYPSN